jgi:HlyD family secretion protein
VTRLDDLRIDRHRRTASRRRMLRWVIPAVTLLLGLLVWLLLARRPAAVAVAEVRLAQPGEQMTELSAAGYVASERMSNVAPKQAGLLRELLVTEGQAVQEGDVIARLDDSDARAQLREAEARARAARAELASASAADAKARRDLDVDARLAASGAISATALLDAQTQANAARAQAGAAREELSAALAAREAARLRLDDMVVRAPFAGTVVKKLADEGAVLAPAAVSDVSIGGIVELVDLNHLNVEAEVSEDRLASIREGQPALIFLDAYPDQVFRGSATTIRPTIDRSKATAIVKVVFDPVPERVYPNMGAKVSFLSGEMSPDRLATEPRLRVPASAVVQRGDRQMVLTVRGGRVHGEPVRVAERHGDEMALVQGPAPGTQVIAAPPKRLREGSRVRVRAGER